LLKDGSVAGLRPSTRDDAGALRSFLATVSPATRRDDDRSVDAWLDVDRLCDSSDPSRAFTLLVTRGVPPAERVVGVGTFVRTDADTADVAFAVDASLRGQGIATSLLESLSLEAARHGIRTFHAITRGDNAAMLAVFRDCGFASHVTSGGDAVRIDLALSPTEARVRAAETWDRANTIASIAPLLRPRAIAVVGVSRSPHGIGRRIFDALRAAHFHGPVHPIAIATAEIDGVPAFPSVSAAPAPVDLAVIAVPHDRVRAVVDDCASAGVRALVVITAGFAEAGVDGRREQDALTAAVRGYGMRMVGPNCLGVLNADPAVSMNASFSPVFPPPGRLAMASHSGAVGVVILSLGTQRHVGMSTFVSLGNRSDVSSNDLLQYWEADADTSVIALYLESFGNPRRFARLARRVGRVKPIIAVKSGRSRAGSRAAGSHTAALVAADTAVDALFRQSGIIRADTIDELFDIAACVTSQPLPKGRRVAILTNAGGPGILAADACEAAGLVVVELGETTRQALRRFLRADASVSNPVDMVASAGPNEYRQAIETLLRASDVDALLVLYTPVDATADDAEILASIQDGVNAARAGGAVDKPVAASLITIDDAVELRAGDEQIPIYAFPEPAARALAKAAAYAEWRAAPAGCVWAFDDVDLDAVRAMCDEIASARGETWLTDAETRRVLDACRLPIVPTALVTSAEEAVAEASRLGWPIAAKIASPGAHKADVGGVRLNLRTADELRTAYDELIAAAAAHGLTLDGIVIQPMARPGTETMIGVVHDRLFGPLVAFGLGGTDVERLDDVRFRIAPLTDRDVDDLVSHSHASVLLAGYRGRPAGDTPALRDLLARASWLADAIPEILELDLNPVIVGAVGEGCTIVDVRIKVGLAAAK
jgi:acyl-CoA synthetase (NDP forming)/GNAT superfamily N-acetyltransferase